MLKYFLIILLATFSLNGFSQEIKCKKFKNGTYVTVDSKYDKIIVRKGKKQIELDRKTGLKIEFTIKWMDKCTYRKNLVGILENPNKVNFPRILIINSTIKEIKNDHTILMKYQSDLGSENAEVILKRIE
jgi:hypothetical protein